MKLIKEFARFISAREDVRVKRAAGQRPPWTKDPVLATYRFCNINREHDPVTIGIRKLYAAVPNEDLWVHLVIARLFNHLPTLRGFGTMTPRSWETAVRNVTRKMKERDERIFNPAYIVSTNGRAKDKVEYLVEDVLRPMEPFWRNLHMPTTCQGWADFLLPFQGMGDFMTNQIVTDMKYTVLLPRKTKGWETFVLAGPGTKRGLNRLYGSPTDASINRGAAIVALMEVRDWLRDNDHPLISYFDDLNNLSNSFCEFDKYMRVSTGEGKPKQRYHHG